MPLPALATVADLEIRVGRPFTPEETALAAELLRDVSAVVRMEAATDFVDANGSLVLPDTVRALALLVGRRAFMNPRSIVSTQIGGYSERVSESETMNIFLTPTEKRMLRAAMGRTNAGSIRVREAHEWPDASTVWAYASEGFDPIPMEEA